MVSIVLGILILGYVFWIIRRRVKKIKNGQFCNCGCDSCSSNVCQSKINKNL